MFVNLRVESVRCEIEIGVPVGPSHSNFCTVASQLKELPGRRGFSVWLEEKVVHRPPSDRDEVEDCSDLNDF